MNGRRNDLVELDKVTEYVHEGKPCVHWAQGTWNGCSSYRGSTSTLRDVVLPPPFNCNV